MFETGDEVLRGLKTFAREQRLSASQFTAIGAFSDAVLGFFELRTREHKRIPVTEQVEVLSLVGDVALTDGESQLHAHVVLGKSDGTAHGGHLLEAHVRPNLIYAAGASDVCAQSTCQFATFRFGRIQGGC